VSENRGAFLSFEGIDGSGKSTQLQRLAERLEAAGLPVVRAQEPGGTRVGLEIRKILLDRASGDLRALPELLLYFASRAQNVEEVIRPALEQGRIVLADRFTDASAAYQGYGRGLGAETVAALHRVACKDLQPDITFFLDVDVETGLRRARRHLPDRLEQESLEFYQRVREGYLEIAAREPRRVLVIEGRRAPEEIAAEIWSSAEGFLAARKLLG
jgi:dTMP kinase